MTHTVISYYGLSLGVVSHDVDIPFEGGKRVNAVLAQLAHQIIRKSGYFHFSRFSLTS